MDYINFDNIINIIVLAYHHRAVESRIAAEILEMLYYMKYSSLIIF